MRAFNVENSFQRCIEKAKITNDADLVTSDATFIERKNIIKIKNIKTLKLYKAESKSVVPLA